MALENPCVQRILCGTLGVAARNGLRSALNALQVVYETNLAALRANLVVLDLALIPVQFAESGANLARQAAETPLTAIDPLAEAAEVCADLGNLLDAFSFQFDTIDAQAADVLDKARRLLSTKDLIEAQILDLEAKIEVLSRALVVLDAC